jgi:hypothetical protein
MAGKPKHCRGGGRNTIAPHRAFRTALRFGNPFGVMCCALCTLRPDGRSAQLDLCGRGRAVHQQGPAPRARKDRSNADRSARGVVMVGAKLGHLLSQRAATHREHRCGERVRSRGSPDVVLLQRIRSPDATRGHRCASFIMVDGCRRWSTSFLARVDFS